MRYAQYNLVSPCDQPGDLETFHSIAAGVSYFPFTWKNRWKFSAEVAHLFDALDEFMNDLNQGHVTVSWEGGSHEQTRELKSRDQDPRQ